MRLNFLVISAALVILLPSLSFCQWTETLSAFCRIFQIPPFTPTRSLTLKRLSDFSPVALAWELRNSRGQVAFAITDLNKTTLYELSFSDPFWMREKVFREKMLTRYGSFLSDGVYHWLYRGLCKYGLAVQKGMVVRMNLRTFDLLPDGRDDGVWEKPFSHLPLKVQGNRTFSVFGFLLLPTLRSSHATAAAMWLLGKQIVDEKTPYQAVIGSLSGLISRCLCDHPEKPFVHEIEKGVLNFLRLQGRKGVSLKTFLASETPWTSIREKLRENKSALLTILYRKEQKRKEDALMRRDGTSLLVIGFWESPFGIYLFTLSPLPATEKPKKVDRLADGVTLIRYDGPCVNLVLTFLEEGGNRGGRATR